MISDESRISTERLQSAMDRAGLNQASLASKVGMRPQGIQAILAGNSRRPRKLREIARAVSVSEAYLLNESDDPRPDDVPMSDADVAEHMRSVPAHVEMVSEGRRTVAIMGRVGAGAEITPTEEQIPPDGLFDIEAPFPLPDDAQAFEVSGDSMWPRYDHGDVVIVWKVGTHPNDVIGWEAAVRTVDGRRYLKRVLQGVGRNIFDLESHNAPPIRGVRLEWVAPIHSVIRSGQWKKLNDQGRRNLLRKMTKTA